MMKQRSLVRRATIAVLGIELLCGLGFSAAALLHEREVHWRTMGVMLNGRADSLIGAIQDAEDPDDNVMVNPQEFQPGHDDQYAVYSQEGKLIGSSQRTDAVALQSHEGLRDVRTETHHYRVLQRNALRIIDRAETNGEGRRRPVVVVYALSTDRMWHQIFETTRFYLLLCVAAVGITAILLAILARRLLQPLQELAVAAGAIEPATLVFNAPPSAADTIELRPLAEALQRMIGRLRVAFDAEKQFFHDAAHELKTAAAVVRSSIQVLDLKPRTSVEYRAGLERVLQDNERLEELISRMLSLARYDVAAAVTTDRISLGEQTDQVAEALSTYAELRGVRLEVRREADPGVCLTPDAVQTLVSNLLTNAIQHSTSGSVVRARITEKASREAELVVEDSGSGIGSEHLPHVFERFYREDTSRSRETGGAGLGLSICKSIVDAARGDIKIESEPGQGTRITVRFVAPESC